jgi:hypothetical protein
MPLFCGTEISPVPERLPRKGKKFSRRLGVQYPFGRVFWRHCALIAHCVVCYTRPQRGRREKATSHDRSSICLLEEKKRAFTTRRRRGHAGARI